MSYNEITVGDKTVQGHRYAGGGGTSNTHDYVASADTSFSVTAGSDSMMTACALFSGNASVFVTISINGISCGGLSSMGSTALVSPSVSFPVKANDVVKFDVASKGSICKIRWMRMLNR